MNKKVTKNASWDKYQNPFFTIITPVYNREKTLKRTFKSVEKQTFKDFEYIIIDDGSTDASLSISKEFLQNSDLPVCLIEKNNGGVHTARNEGFKKSRGKLVICIDSDDELLPDACKIFFDAWLSIPEHERDNYWQIKAPCVYPDGQICSTLFPEGINEMDVNEAYKHFSLSKGEQLGCRVAAILKKNLFPEPEGVKFVNEVVVWLPLEKKYLSWGINQPVRIYHTEGNDRLTNTKVKSYQSCINALWNSAYEINNPDIFNLDCREFIKSIFRHSIMKQILMPVNPEIVKMYAITNLKGRVLEDLLWGPAKIGANIYKRKKMTYEFEKEEINE